MTRMTRQVHRPAPARPTWQPVTDAPPAWMRPLIARRQDAPAVATVPCYAGPCRWKQRRNQQIRQEAQP
jgi:hypothetical protein